MLLVIVILLFCHQDERGLYPSWNVPLTFCLALSPNSGNVIKTRKNQQRLADITFPRTWVPMASIQELDPQRPTPLQFHGQRYIAYHDTQSWVVLDDSCPHRLAPLSEGRVNEKGILECSYHGWGFGSNGTCVQIPQFDRPVEERSQVQSYPVQVHKNVLFVWPWSDEDPLICAKDPWRAPEHMVSSVPLNPNTYTRDLPYGWSTLVENIVDPSHVPWAHHGLQGTREDAIPINMTVPVVTNSGFNFSFEDRTMKMMRQCLGFFRAPYVVSYTGTFNSTQRPFFNLTTLLIPTKPGWSRIIIYSGGDEKQAKKKKFSVFGLLVKVLPVWLLHQFSNRFLDTDLVFLHVQEQERKFQNYYMPAASDRCIVALQKWIREYAPDDSSLPPRIEDKRLLFDHYQQHTDQCRHCNRALQRIRKGKTRSFQLMIASVLLLSLGVVARVALAAALTSWALLQGSENLLLRGDFKHYLNH